MHSTEVSPISKVLCVCMGNGDRSPALAGILDQFLRLAGYSVTVESAGILESADKGGPPAEHGKVAAGRLGVDFSKFRRRWVNKLDLAEFDLVIVVDDAIAETLMYKLPKEQRVPEAKIYNAKVGNPWPVKFQEDYDWQVMPVILAAAYRILKFYGDRFATSPAQQRSFEEVTEHCAVHGTGT